MKNLYLAFLLILTPTFIIPLNFLHEYIKSLTMALCPINK